MRLGVLQLGLFLSLILYLCVKPMLWDNRAVVRGEVKAGYVLPSQFSRILALGFTGLYSDFLFLKTATFYGGRINQKQELNNDDWNYLVASLDVITDLDPYFLDPYVLAEGHLAWNGKIAEANRLLEKGMKARNWDWRLPYYIGFNYFHFLQEYEKASFYIMEAANRPKSYPFLKTLGARLAYYGGKTETAIHFLQGMILETSDPRFREPLELRLSALRSASELEKLVVQYTLDKGRAPSIIEDLVVEGYIPELPVDPYGGSWKLLNNGRVYSSSRFAKAPQK